MYVHHVVKVEHVLRLKVGHDILKPHALPHFGGLLLSHT